MNPQKIDSSGALLKSSWALFAAHWQVLTTIAIIPIVINYIATLLFGFHGLGSIASGVVLSITAAILSVIMTAGLIRAVHALSTDASARLTVLGQYRLGFGYFWSVVLVSILGSLAGIGSFVLLIIPSLIVGVYVAFYLYSCVVDGVKGLSALMESYSIVYGRWMDVFVRLLILALVMFAGYAVVVALNVVVSYSVGVDAIMLAKAQQHVPVAISVAGFVFNLVSQAILGPFSIIYSYKLYQSLKATRRPDVSVTAFKRWAVAFMIIGPVFFIIAIVTSIGFVMLQHS